MQDTPEQSIENSEPQKRQWAAPKVTTLDVESTQGGGFGGNETDTTKPGS